MKCNRIFILPLETVKVYKDEVMSHMYISELTYHELVELAIETINELSNGRIQALGMGMDAQTYITDSLYGMNSVVSNNEDIEDLVIKLTQLVLIIYTYISDLLDKIFKSIVVEDRRLKIRMWVGDDMVIESVTNL